MINGTLSQLGGFRPIATPEGVPVITRVPGLSVMLHESHSMIAATPYIMSEVFSSCWSSPLTCAVTRRVCGSGISSGVTKTPPIGQCVSKDLPLIHCPPPPFSCQYLLETSFVVTYPATANLVTHQTQIR